MIQSNSMRDHLLHLQELMQPLSHSCVGCLLRITLKTKKMVKHMIFLYLPDMFDCFDTSQSTIFQSCQDDYLI